MKKEFKVYILCFPRNASRYFAAILESKIGKGTVYKTHNPGWSTKDKKVIGLIRNPLDQFASAMSQAFEFDQIGVDPGQTKEEKIIQQVRFQTQRYCEIMNEILSKANIIFDYDFFTSMPNEAADMVVDMINETDLGLEPEIPETRIDSGMTYMKSSKESSQYSFIRSVIEKQDLSVAQAKYLELLSSPKLAKSTSA